MRPSDVPRRREIWGAAAMWHEYNGDDNSHGAYFRRESWFPGRDLQEELEAAILRRAHKKLQLQKAAGELDTRFVKSSLAGISHLHQVPDASQVSINLETSSEFEDSSAVSDGTTTGVDRKVRRSERSSSSSGSSSRSEPLPSPSMLLDDEITASALRPSVRECMSRLNRLLDALHRSRKGSREYGTLSRNQSRDLTTAKRRSRDLPVQLENPPLVGKTKAIPFGKQVLRPTKSSDPRDVACRDWSEILSLAATTGWDQTALERAAQRCATLFGETMELRCISGHMATHTHPESFFYGPDTNALTMPKDSAAARTSSTPRMFACLYSQCERHRVPFVQRWELRQHLKRSHKAQNADIGSIMTAIDESHHREGATNIESKLNAMRDDVLCPITICMPNSRG
jgi:hypothetical protein